MMEFFRRLTAVGTGHRTRQYFEFKTDSIFYREATHHADDGKLIRPVIGDSIAQSFPDGKITLYYPASSAIERV
ncbi:MAG: hypothetical protein HC908_12895 [Calothrix sp. SM1_7_51]|nr:hypothetical protein [Calothrix sp. SM1_7_51]